MVVNDVDCKRALKSVSDSFKKPFKKVFQPGTALIFRAAQIVADELLIFSSICPYLKSSRAARFVDCSWKWLGWFEQGVGIILTDKG